jgi:hypothetical protein
MGDRDLVELVPLLHDVRNLGHDLLRHAFVGLVFEGDHLAAARLPPDGSLERRDRAGALVGYLGDDLSQVERTVDEP